MTERADTIKLLNQTADACRIRSKYNVGVCHVAGCKMLSYCRGIILKKFHEEEE